MILPTRMTRYVVAELTTPTILGLFLWTFLLLMNHFFIIAEKAIAKSLSFDLTLRMFMSGIPSLLTITIPMAVILGSLIAIGRLSADQEWLALQSAGQGPWRLLKPLIVHGLIWSLLAFFVYSYAVPRANYAIRNLRGEILSSSNLAADLRPRVFYSGLPNTVLFVDEIKAGSKGKMEDVLLVQAEEDKTIRLMLAKSADMYPAADGSGDLIIDLYGGVGHRYLSESEEGVYQLSPGFGSTSERIPREDYLKGFLEPPQKVNQDLFPHELFAKYREAREARLEMLEGAEEGERRPDRFIAEHTYRAVAVELHQRLALPLASLFFAILSLPLGVTRVRSGKGAGFALSLLVILVYWVSFTFARDQAYAGKLDSALGPWAGNIIIALWALFALWRMRRTAQDRTGLLTTLYFLTARTLRGLSSMLAGLRRKPPAAAATQNGDTEAEAAAPLSDLGGTDTRFVGLLDRYVSLAYVRILGLTMLFAYMIYALLETKRLMDGLLRTGQPFSLVLIYLPYFVPGVLYVVLPISCLVGSVVTFTLLTRSGELTAVKASGISMRRVVVPVAVLTAALCGLLFLVQDRIAPGTNRKAQALKDRILGRTPRTYGMPATGRWSFGPQQGQRLYHYKLFDADREEFQGLSVFTLDRMAPRVLDHRFCERARWLGDFWELEGGWYRTFPADGSIDGITFEQNEGLKRLRLDPPENFASKEISLTSVGDLPEQMSMRELQGQISTLDESGYDTTQLRVALHGKLAQALSPLVMVLLGLPFAFKVGRRGSLYGIGVALLLVLVYWAVFATFNALGLENMLDPRAAAWGPNVLFGLLGIYLLLYIKT
jgi:LPS export ABC transporter permease LptG/LPS export ABC transporter permease LptF